MQMEQHIYTAADGNYSLQAQVLALSLKKTQSRQTFLTVFGNGWSEKNRKSLLNLSNETLIITQEEVPTEAFSSIKLANGFPLATAYNILGPKFLLKPSLRYLYVDADTVVRKDLGELWQIEMNHAVGATLDAHIGWASSPSMWRPWIEENLDPMTPYLNTGVLLIDVDRWNEQQLTERVVEKLSLYQLPCVDQDAINLVLKGNFDVLQPRYNSMPYHILSSFRYVDALTPQNEIETALVDPCIVHFHRSFLGKPWEIACAHPGKNLWRNLANEVQPKWRKTLDVKGLARRRAARWAKMLRIDTRVRKLDSL
jgi:lipopolysaccharide biosynthesis glycosyltransferase